MKIGYKKLRLHQLKLSPKKKQSPSIRFGTNRFFEFFSSRQPSNTLFLNWNFHLAGIDSFFCGLFLLKGFNKLFCPKKRILSTNRISILGNNENK